MAQVEAPWRLWVFAPDHPGHLESCSDGAPRANLILLEAALTIHWEGGDLVQPEVSNAQIPWTPFNACFVLKVDSQTIAAGAVVLRASARLLRSPTLVLQGDAEKQPLRFELTPSFPASGGQPAPDLWRTLLGPQSRRPAL